MGLDTESQDLTERIRAKRRQRQIEQVLEGKTTVHPATKAIDTTQLPAKPSSPPVPRS